MSRSNLTEAISAIDRCSDDELRQIQALIGVRLDGVPAVKNRGTSRQKVVAGKKGETPRTNSQGKPRKGNPRRKSQYATHPLWKSYKAAQKAVQDQAKDEGIAFKDVTGDAHDNYIVALEAWIQAKHGFRASKGETTTAPVDNGAPAPSSEGHGGEILQPHPSVEKLPETAGAIVPKEQAASIASPGDRPNKRSRTSQSEEGGKYSHPPPVWDPDTVQEWNTLKRSDRKSAWRTYYASQTDSDVNMLEGA